jgi:hypothetical protein
MHHRLWCLHDDGTFGCEGEKGAALDLLREKAEVSFFLVREKIRFSLRIINQICLN